jgi:hypothetical protein
LNRDALDAVRQADCAILALRRARERDDNRLRLHDHQGIHNARRKPIEAGKNQTIEIAGSENIVALRRWIKLKARRRFRKVLGAPQSAKIHRPKIKNSRSGNRENRAERRLHVTHQVKNRTQYRHSYVCLVAVVIDFLLDGESAASDNLSRPSPSPQSLDEKRAR